MALVCDVKSEEPTPQAEPDEDLEDGEIEDDDEIPPEPPAQAVENASSHPNPAAQHGAEGAKADRDRPRDRSREKRDRRHKDKDTRHMTEAEKSILHLRRKERMEREKWSKYRKDHQNVETQDDFAINLEKTLASILKKDRLTSDEDKDEDRRCNNKRKKRGKENEHKAKQRKIESPKLEEPAEGEAAPPPEAERDERTRSPRSDNSNESESSETGKRADDAAHARRRENRRENRKTNKNKSKNRDRNFKRDRSKEKKVEQPAVDSKGICIFYLNGKCNKTDCIYSHEAVAPMKLELCKFYLMDCCAKGENCSYMHSEFPCKFYHMGLPCNMGDNCKFAHGKPLSDGLKQILFKHIETAPRDILGGFPRLSRDETLNMMDVTQKNLIGMYKETSATQGDGQDDAKQEADAPGADAAIPSLFDIDVPIPAELREESVEIKPKLEKRKNRPSRWQEAEPAVATDNFQVNFTPFSFNKDQDMRVSSNGDVDMRTLPNLPQPIALPVAPSLDVDIRTLPPPDNHGGLPTSLPKTQRDLFMRIQAQQKDNLLHESNSKESEEERDVQETNWYSDDDDDDDDAENRLTIEVGNEEPAGVAKEEPPPLEPPVVPAVAQGPIKPADMDLSKINITADITKLLSSLSANLTTIAATEPSEEKQTVRDPRLSQPEEPTENAESKTRDPRKAARQPPSEKLSIYEQGAISVDDADIKIDGLDEYKSATRPDVDLRTMILPFKGMMNYTPATEIDASTSSHPPMSWKVLEVEVPRPDYSGLKLSVSDAEKTGDPRLRKIFRLSVEERDTPASPKESPKSTPTVRIDPRLRKTEEPKLIPSEQSPMNYNQQITAIQSSAFYQSLTSSQKLMLNQELASRSNQTGSHDPFLNSLLTDLNLIGGATNPPNMQNPGMLTNFLQNINKINPMAANGMMPPPNMMNHQNMLNPNQPLMNQNPGMMNPMVQPGLLGVAPGIPNMTPDFPINFDPRNQNSLLGNGPPFNNFDNANGPPGGFQNFPNDDFYPQDNNSFRPNNNQSRNDRGHFNNRDRRRGGRNNFARNHGNRNQFRRNQGGRSNRPHTPP